MGAIVDPAAFQFTVENMYNFPVCVLCVHWSPFLIYLDENPQVKKYRRLPSGMHLYCPSCAPEPDHFRQRFPGEKIFRDDSILNDQKLMELLGDYQYDHPRKKGLWELDRIIITERTRLREPYKKLTKKPLPRMRKLEKLMELFPQWHRMANSEFASFRAMRSAIRQKVSQIDDSYMNLTETEHSQMQDNIDALVDRTPMHARMVSQQQQQQQRALMPPPMAPPVEVVELELQPAAADVTGSSLGSISFSSETHSMTENDTVRIDSSSSSEEPIITQGTQESLSQGRRSGIQLFSQSANFSSQNLQISSQDLSGPGGILLDPVEPSASPRPRPLFTVRSTISTSPSLSNASVVSIAGQASPSPAVARRSKRSHGESSSETDGDRTPSPSTATLPIPMAGPPTPNDGQVAGPSRKRQRNELPMNPTPQDFVRNPVGRMPRVNGA